MLKFLRNKKVQHRIYLILALIIIPPFIFWGVFTSSEDDKSGSELGKIDGRKITAQEYLNQYKAVQRQAQMMFGDRINEFRGQINFKGEAWDRLLLLAEAKRRGVRVSDGEVVDWIAKQPLFSRDGRFDAGFYKMVVTRALRVDTRAFEEEIRQTLLIQKLRDKVQGPDPVQEEAVKLAVSFRPKENPEAAPVVTETPLLTKADPIPDVEYSEELINAAFTLEKGSESEWVKLEKGDYKIKVIEKQKSNDAMADLLQKLRGKLELNLELMRDIFTPSSPESPSTPS